jgi:hypothetical protein
MCCWTRSQELRKQHQRRQRRRRKALRRCSEVLRRSNPSESSEALVTGTVLLLAVTVMMDCIKPPESTVKENTKGGKYFESKLVRLSDQDAINTRVPDRKQRKQCEDAKRRYVPRDSY